MIKILILLTTLLYGSNNEINYNSLIINCEAGDMNECDKVGRWFYLDSGGSGNKDYSNAIHYLTLACDAKKLGACGWLGDIYSQKGKYLDIDKSIELYNKACYGDIDKDNELAVFCGELGKLYLDNGLYSLAKEPSKRSCNYGITKGCYNLGTLYLDDNVFEAKSYFQKACDLKHGDACYWLGNMYYKGVGVRQDYKMAKYHYGLACDYRSSNGCKEYAKMNTSKDGK